MEGINDYPFGKGENEPLYLTNGCCEHAHGDAALMDEFGLGYSENPDGTDFYPLNDAESRYIAEDMAELDGGLFALMGYSCVFQGRKFYMPSIEIMQIPGDRDAEEIGKEFAAAVAERVKAEDGHVLRQWNDDRYLVRVLIPVERAETFDGYEDWKAFLVGDLLSTKPSAEPGP